jgi:hypothetical protein
MIGYRERAAAGLQVGDFFKTSRTFSDGDLIRLAPISRDQTVVFETFVTVKILLTFYYQCLKEFGGWNLECGIKKAHSPQLIEENLVLGIAPCSLRLFLTGIP